jgi:hypothetical protein
MCKPRAAGDLVRAFEGSSCHPKGVGGIGVNVVCPGLLVGGAESRGCDSTPGPVLCGPAPGPTLCDLELLGGGPGGGGGNGTFRPQLPCGTIGDSSIGVLISVPWPNTPADAARRAAGALKGEWVSGLYRCSCKALFK